MIDAIIRDDSPDVDNYVAIGHDEALCNVQTNDNQSSTPFSEPNFTDAVKNVINDGWDIKIVADFNYSDKGIGYLNQHLPISLSLAQIGSLC